MYRINLFKPGSATRIGVKHYPHLNVQIDDSQIRIDWKRMRFVLAAAVAANIVCYASTLPLTRERDALMAQQTELAARLSQLRPAVQQAEQLRAEIDSLVDALNLVSEMAATTSNWSGILDEIHRLLPYDAWLVRIESRLGVEQEVPVTGGQNKGGGQNRSAEKEMIRADMVDVEGVAVNYLSFSEFLMRLRQSQALFTNVEVISSEETPEGVRFLIRLHLHPRRVRF